MQHINIYLLSPPALMITSVLLFQLLQRECLLRRAVNCDTRSAAKYSLIKSLLVNVNFPFMMSLFRVLNVTAHWSVDSGALLIQKAASSQSKDHHYSVFNPPDGILVNWAEPSIMLFT